MPRAGEPKRPARHDQPIAGTDPAPSARQAGVEVSTREWRTDRRCTLSTNLVDSKGPALFEVAGKRDELGVDTDGLLRCAPESAHGLKRGRCDYRNETVTGERLSRGMVFPLDAAVPKMPRVRSKE